MELNSLRKAQQIKKEEFDKINSQLQQLVSENYQTLLNTSESVIKLSQISHFLNNQIKVINDTMQTLKPIEEVKEETKPKTTNEKFLEFLMLYETVSDFLEQKEYLKASQHYIEMMKNKDNLLANKRYGSYLSKRMRILCSSEKKIVDVVKQLFAGDINSIDENKVIEAFVVFVKHSNQRLVDIFQIILLQRRQTIIQMSQLHETKEMNQQQTTDVLSKIYNYILDTYDFIRKYFTVDYEGKMQLMYNNTYRESNDYFLNFTENIDDNLLQWKRVVQQEIGTLIISQFDAINDIHLLKEIAMDLVKIKKERNEDDLIFDSIFYIPLNRRISTILKDIWKKEFGVFQNKNTLQPNTLKTKVNLNALFFESGEVKTSNELASSFVDNKAVEQFSETFENCFAKISNELNEIYNEDGSNKHPEIFSLDKTKDEVFAQGFLLWCDNLTEELFQMNNEVDRNKSNGVVFKTLLFDFLSYSCFVHQCTNIVLTQSEILKQQSHSIIIIKEALSLLSYKSGQYFFDTILTNLRVAFLKDAAMEQFGYNVVKNIVWKRVAFNDEYYLTVSNPSYITDRFYSRMNCVLGCLGNVESSLMVYCHTQIINVLMRKFDDYMRIENKDFTIQFICDLMTMRYGLLKANELFFNELEKYFVPLQLMEKLRNQFEQSLAKIEQKVEELKQFFDDIEFCLYFNDSKTIAIEYYERKTSVYPLIFFKN